MRKTEKYNTYSYFYVTRKLISKYAAVVVIHTDRPFSTKICNRFRAQTDLDTREYNKLLTQNHKMG